MKKNKLVVIGVYFGTLPNYMDLWLKSCYYNKKIDFKVFTDDNRFTSKNNVEFINMNISEFKLLIEKKLCMNISLERPYKCCDYKPLYGIVLEEYIKEYDFWAHCDFDLIFGDILSFLTDEILNKHDKLLPLGHLSFYRNTLEVNNRYMCDGGKSYKDAFSTDAICFFDEYDGMLQKYRTNKFPFYDKRVFADISVIYKRFRLANNDLNYNKQVFYWYNGKVFRAYEKKGKIFYDEFIYIHFKQRKNMKVNFENLDNVKSFYITNQGFFEKIGNGVSIIDMDKYNEYSGFFHEQVEKISYGVKKMITRIKNKMRVKK